MYKIKLEIFFASNGCYLRRVIPTWVEIDSWQFSAAKSLLSNFFPIFSIIMHRARFSRLHFVQRAQYSDKVIRNFTNNIFDYCTFLPERNYFQFMKVNVKFGPTCQSKCPLFCLCGQVFVGNVAKKYFLGRPCLKNDVPKNWRGGCEGVRWPPN